MRPDEVELAATLEVMLADAVNAAMVERPANSARFVGEYLLRAADAKEPQSQSLESLLEAANAAAGDLAADIKGALADAKQAEAGADAPRAHTVVARHRRRRRALLCIVGRRCARSVTSRVLQPEGTAAP